MAFSLGPLNLTVMELISQCLLRKLMGSQEDTVNWIKFETALEKME